ncbi:unnamed protein product [Cuscuta campestris]|uniref:Uncharacterized protein n=1 Tax=Cuscuta campestris TaxID=132261 RepID=A0A484KM07_9ASTE|nr:unnamed protein product [Cuscuta campestris]
MKTDLSIWQFTDCRPKSGGIDDRIGQCDELHDSSLYFAPHQCKHYHRGKIASVLAKNLQGRVKHAGTPL